MPWPDLSQLPRLTAWCAPGLDFDEILARHAEKAGARLLEGVTVTGPVLDDRTGRVIGVAAQERGRQGRPEHGSARRSWSRRTATRPGCRCRWACASATTGRSASRCGPTTPRRGTTTTSWRPGSTCGTASSLLPGYGWIFGMGDGTSNVGLGLLNTSASFQNIDYRALLRRWLAAMPAEWGLTEENRTAADPRRGAADGLQPDPALHQRPAAGRRRRRHGQPVQRRGHRATRWSPARSPPGSIVQALARPTAAGAETRAADLPGGAEGRATAATTRSAGSSCTLIGKPWFMQFATRHGVKRPAVMRFTMKLLGNLTETRGGDAVDRADQRGV